MSDNQKKNPNQNRQSGKSPKESEQFGRSPRKSENPTCNPGSSSRNASSFADSAGASDCN